MSELPPDEPFFRDPDAPGGDAGERERLELLRQELLERERYLEELQARLEDAARRSHAVPGPSTAGSTGVGPVQRVSSSAILAAAACLTVALTAVAWFSEPPRVLVTGTISAGPGAADLLAACAQALADEPELTVETDRGRGQVYLRLTSEDGAAGEARVDRLGRKAVESVRDAALRGAASRPASEGELREIETGLGDIDRRLEALGAAPLSEVRGPLAMTTWKSMMEERRAIQAQLSELTGMIARPKPDETSAPVDPDRLESARSADQRLQADLVGLRQRQTELTAALSEAMRATDPTRQALSPALANARAQLVEIRDRTSDPQAAAHVSSVLKVLERWSDGAVALDRAWQIFSSEQGGPPPLDDLLSRRQDLEQAGTLLVDATRDGLTQVADELERMVQGGGEPAKRLVLRNSLVRDLRPVLEAQRSLAAAVMGLLPEHHRPLAGLYESVTALREQVRGHEERIRGEVQARLREELIVEHEKMQAQLLADQQRLLRRDAELDAALMENAEKALAALVETGRERSVILQQMELYRQRGELLDRLGEATQRLARQERHALAGLVQLAYVPSEARRLVIPAGPRLGRALLIGVWPMVAAGVLLVARQSRRKKSGRSLGGFVRTLQASPGGEPTSES